MSMTLKVAVAVLLVASLTAGCGRSEANCWAERQTIAAEAQVWAAMDDATVVKKLKLGDHSFWQASAYRAREIARLEASMPDC